MRGPRVLAQFNDETGQWQPLHKNAKPSGQLKYIRDPGKGFTGLRSLATGFTPADGYDLSKFSEWTPAQKRKISEYMQEVDELLARPHAIMRFRREDHLRAAQRTSDHKPKFKQLKVAVVKWTPPREQPDLKPAVKFRKDGAMQITNIPGKPIEYLFNMERLATDTKAEVRRITDRNPPDMHYRIICGKYVKHGGFRDATSVLREVEKLKAKYDTEQSGQLVKDGRIVKRKDHDYRDWLIGLEAYGEFKDRSAEKDWREYAHHMYLEQIKHRNARRAERARVRRTGEFSTHVAKKMKGTKYIKPR